MDPLENVLEAPTTETPTGDLLDDFVSSLTAEETTTPETPATEVPPTTPETPPTKETPEEPAKTDDEELPAEPKNRKDWDTLRGSRDRWKQTAEEVQTVAATKDQTIQALTAELEEFKTKASRLPELEDKLKMLDEYEKELSVTRIEATREYKETIVQPLQVIGQTADTLAKTNDTDPDLVFDMIREADPAKQRAAFKELTSGWDDVDRAELWTMAKDARVILDKQDQMRENASAAAKEQADLAAKRAQAEKETFLKEFVASTKDVTKSLREKTPFIPVAEGETEEDRYRALEEKVSSVDFDAQTPRGKAFAAATALLYPQMVKTIQKLQAEAETLRARVKAENSGKASVSPSEQSRPASEEGMDFLAAMGVPTSNSLNVIGL